MAEISTYVAGASQSAMNRQLKKFTDDCLQPHGLTTMQWFIVGIIYDAGDTGILVTEISKRVDTNVPYITNTLNLLEQKGAVIKDMHDEDSRKKIVRIAPEFIATCDAIEVDLRQKMRAKLYDNITPDELKTYLTVVAKINLALTITT